MAVRAALLVVALVAALWLASAFPGARDEARATALGTASHGRLTPAERTRAIALLDGARRYRPDSTIVPTEAGLLVGAGRSGAAAALLRPLVRAEPENATAWAVLALALAHSDPAGARAALARRAALIPPISR
jgi:predicted Zn-dependent protease